MTGEVSWVFAESSLLAYGSHRPMTLRQFLVFMIWKFRFCCSKLITLIKKIPSRLSRFGVWTG